MIEYYLRALLIHCFVLFFKLGIFVLVKEKVVQSERVMEEQCADPDFFWREEGRGLRIIRVA